MAGGFPVFQVPSSPVTAHGAIRFERVTVCIDRERVSWHVCGHSWNVSPISHCPAVLALLTLRKCGHQIEHFQAACRDVRREVPTAALSQDSSASWIQIAREPTPAAAAMLAETVEKILDKLKERERPVFLLSLEGYSAVEISAQVGRSERTVYRVLDHIKQELQRAGAEHKRAIAGGGAT